jgi:hypothetical protein
MGPELTLLLEICAKARNLKTNKSFPMRRVDLDEKKFIQLLDRHMVCELAYRGIKHFPGILSEQCMTLLKRKVMGRQVRKGIVLREWQKVTSCLETAGIPLLSIKGPALSLQLFGDPSERDFGDLDFIVDVKNRDMEELTTILQTIGYTDHNSFLTYEQRQFLNRKSIHRIFENRNTGMNIEIHSKELESLRNLLNLNVNTLFLQSEPVTWNSFEYLTPCKEDHTLIVIAHGAKHAWYSLRWILDAAAIFQNHWNINWRHIDSKIKQFGLERIVLSTVTLIHRFCGIEIDENPMINNTPSTFRVRKLSSYAYRQLKREHISKTEKWGLLRLLSKYTLFLKKEVFYKINVLRAYTVPNDKDLSVVRLPYSLSFLYYFMRPFLLILRWTRSALR